MELGLEDEGSRDWRAVGLVPKSSPGKSKEGGKDTEPYCIIGSPPCTAFSIWNQGMNFRKMPQEKIQQAMHEGRLHLNFMASLYRRQMAKGKFFLHEHPFGAWSWKLDFVLDFCERNGVERVRGDQCPFGQQSWDREGQGLVLKPTGWLSSSPAVLAEVSRRCSNSTKTKPWHRHILLEAGRAKAAERYPPVMIEAILRGIKA